MDNLEVPAMVEKLKEALTFVSDTFVNASHLAETVKTLQSQATEMTASFQSQIDSLKQEVEYMRQQNSLLDENVQRLRNERDTAQTEAQSLRTENAQLVHDAQTRAAEIESAYNEITRLKNELEAVKRDNDNAQYEAIHWKDKHDKLRDAHDSVLKALGVEPQPRNESGQFQPYPRAVGDTPF